MTQVFRNNSLFWALALPFAWACSSKPPETAILGGTGGASGAAPGAGGGGSSAVASGGMAHSTGGSLILFGGAAGTANTAGSLGGGNAGASGAGGRMVEENCAATKVPSKDLTMIQPADIIFAIDSSSSMNAEIQFVQTEMNRFSQQIVAAGVDVRVILLGDERAICFGAPLGSGQCPDDTNMPSYIHINQKVGSRDALDLIVSTFPRWQQYLRPEASKSFVVVTDDNASGTAQAFTTAVNALDPVLFAKWTMNGVYCFTRCAEAAAIGSQYVTLVQQTMGVGGDLCMQNFQPVFDQLAKQIVTNSGVQIACEWDLQPPMTGRTYAGDLVQVARTSMSAGSSPLTRVKSEAACAAGGWYFDSNLNPTKILACPSTCMGIQNQVDGAIEITFGCEMVGGCLASGSSSLGTMPGACEWPLPEPPAGQSLDFTQVNVRYTSPSGFATGLGKVGSSAECGMFVDGWFYDDNTKPTKIVACPQTCTAIQAGGAEAKVEALFGCMSVPPIPR
jgi:hypothetical protein